MSTTGISSPHGMAIRAPVSDTCGCTGGSVRRREQKATVPTRPATMAATRPAAGWTLVASTVAMGGPVMKIVSSTTASRANAVWRSAARSRT